MFPHDQDSLSTIARGLPITPVNFPTYKNGADRHDVVTIGQMASAGKKSEEIAHTLHILEKVIKSFLPEKIKRKRRTPEEMEADKALLN
jgi:hypothetical protein